MTPPILLAVPNVSEGRDARVVGAIATAFAGQAGVRLLDVHSDTDHDRSVLTLAGPPGELADALLRGAAAAVEAVDVMSLARSDSPPDGGPSDGGAPGRAGQHPYVGAVDVAPVVYLKERDRGAACAEALVVADRIALELGVPVFLYGELAGTDGRPPTRGELRRGGVEGLARRMAQGDEQAGGQGDAQGAGGSLRAMSPDFGPARMHPTAGATLVAARSPLVAFNLQLSAPATIEDARAIAALIREGGPAGLPGVRALGIELSGAVAQVSLNVERPLEVPLGRIVQAVAVHAGVASAELVGLAPRAAFEGFPADVPLPGFDPARQLIENALGC